MRYVQLLGLLGGIRYWVKPGFVYGVVMLKGTAGRMHQKVVALGHMLPLNFHILPAPCSAPQLVSLNNLINCNKALPELSPMQWNEPQEIKDVFQVYIAKVRRGALNRGALISCIKQRGARVAASGN